jgi:hypothetical protein
MQRSQLSQAARETAVVEIQNDKKIKLNRVAQRQLN